VPAMRQLTFLERGTAIAWTKPMSKDKRIFNIHWMDGSVPSIERRWRRDRDESETAALEDSDFGRWRRTDRQDPD